MNLKEKSYKFLNVLYFRSHHDLRSGYDVNVVAKLIGLSDKERMNVQSYLFEKNLISDSGTFGALVRLTADGIDTVEELRSNKVFARVKFNSYHVFPLSGLDGIK